MRRAVQVLVVFVAGSCLMVSPVAADQSQASKEAVASQFVQAMAAGDLQQAGRLIRARTPGQREAALATVRAPWRGVTGVQCRQRACYLNDFPADPPLSLLMRNVNGSWWVDGVICCGGSVGVPVLAGTNEYYSGGRRVDPGFPMGRSYWKTTTDVDTGESTWYEAQFLMVERAGSSISLYAYKPEEVRITPEVVACVRVEDLEANGAFDYRGIAVVYGSGDAADGVGSAHVSGRALSTWGVFRDLSFRDSWRRSTATDGGVPWGKVRRTCAANGLS
jgi:hypothetical protein